MSSFSRSEPRFLITMKDESTLLTKKDEPHNQRGTGDEETLFSYTAALPEENYRILEIEAAMLTDLH